VRTPSFPDQYKDSNKHAANSPLTDLSDFDEIKRAAVSWCARFKGVAEESLKIPVGEERPKRFAAVDTQMAKERRTFRSELVNQV